MKTKKATTPRRRSSRGGTPVSTPLSDIPLSTTPGLGNSSSGESVWVNETPPLAGARFGEILTRRSRCGAAQSSPLAGRVICSNVRPSTCVSELRVHGAASRLASCCGALFRAGSTPRFVETRGVCCCSRRPRIHGRSAKPRLSGGSAGTEVSAAES